MPQRIGREFFERGALTVARALLGQTLVRVTAQGETRGVIVETEAYLGELDDAAHTYRGPSERTRVAYGDSGCAYVYLVYGLHCCLNITAGAPGVPEMVLLRALEPVGGLPLMAQRRGAQEARLLCAGPGRLCRAMAVDRSLYGEDLCESGQLFVEYGAPPPHIAATPRIGVDYAEKCRGEPWRFIDTDSRFLSR
ncbi:MAG: DNA-3-methyladenine glycosylase [Oscillospiraceae bacterium]|nr:DNA-3-methyladenine glycosylase [Oscillospiraceae bacterium]